MSKDKKKLYCSLDIETSGFDPLVNEILEVGFAFFEVGKKGMKITEEWTQVFHPSKPVTSGILGLTGISQAELDEAPKFSEFQNFLQEKLGDAVIVGHNITFDIKFLESFGLKFSGGSIDTLDLVQWLLPTHHSYNLENLMHTFGIAHKEAHRALADSKAAISLLEKLLQVYCGLPPNVKKEINRLVADRNFLWKDYLAVELSGLDFNSLQPAVKVPNAGAQVKLQPETVYDFPVGFDYIDSVAASLTSKDLLVVPKVRQVLALYQRGLVQKPIFLPDLQFDPAKFKAVLKRKDLVDEEIKFLLKILVWQATNWQTETIVDLNLSFFGGQFRNLINGGKIKSTKLTGPVACDLSAFFYLADAKLNTEKRAIVCGLNDFENTIVSNIGIKTSWGYINYVLKSFYNPEFKTGQTKFQTAVEEALNATDLFFGLTSALLQSDPAGFVYYKVNQAAQNDERYIKVKAAAAGLAGKLEQINETLSSKDVSDFIKNISGFFTDEDNRVKWIELAENRCAFISMPLDITGLVKQSLKVFKNVSFVDALGSQKLVKYFINRLGLQDFQLKKIQIASNDSGTHKQGDLFSGIKKALGVRQGQKVFHFIDQAATADQLQELASNKKLLPAAILFSSPAGVKEFYDANYQSLKKQASVYAQTNAGGGNKIFRNFGINPNSLLLATDKFVLKHLSSTAAVDPVRKLRVKTLVICRLPFDQFTHPYQEAVSQSLDNAFMDYALPKALLNLHNLIGFFLTPTLEDVYIIDAKLKKEYAASFLEYCQAIPGYNELQN